MKLNKKFLFASALVFLFSATIAYAASSGDYLTKANKFINSNCAKSSISNETSLECYLFYKLGELGTKVDSNTSRILALENLPSPTPVASPSPIPGKELETFDANGVELGLYVDRDSFFYTPLGVIVTLVNGNDNARIGITADDIYFQNNSCTGQAYGLFSGTGYWGKVNELITGGVGHYYTVERTPGSTTSFSSFLRYTGGSFVCSSTSINEIGVKLTPVTLLFSEPIPLPLQYKNQ